MSKSFVIVVDPCSDAAIPPITTNRTSWRARTPRIGRGSNTTLLADAPCIPYERVDRACCDDGPPQTFFGSQRQRRHELRAIDPATRDVDYVDVEIAGAKDPLQSAVTRVLKTALDGRNHRLGYLRFRCELGLSEPLSLSRSSHEPTGLHIWKSISGGETRADLREEINVGLDDARPGVRVGDEFRTRSPEAVTECRIVDQELADLGELSRTPVREAPAGAARHTGEDGRTRVDDHRTSGGPRLERHERKRLEQARHHKGRAAREPVPFVLFGEAPEVHDAARFRDPDLGIPDEHERNIVRGIARAPALVVREELARALTHTDAPDVEQVRTGDAMFFAEPRRVPLGRHVDPDSDDLVRHSLIPEAAPDHAPLLVGVVGDRARTVEHRFVRGETDRRLLVRRRHQDRTLRYERQTEDRWVIDIGEEQHVVVVAPAPEEEVDELGRVRPLRVDECAFVIQRVARPKGAALVRSEVPCARALDGKASHGDAVHPIEARGEVALPGEVVGRVRRRDFDRELRRETLHDGARVGLRASWHVAVTLHDDEKARFVQSATRSTSCSRRPSNAGQVHSRSTYARPDTPSSSRFLRTAARAVAKPPRSYAAPPLARAT